jgi:hypothetical protein
MPQGRADPEADACRVPARTLIDTGLRRRIRKLSFVLRGAATRLAGRDRAMTAHARKDLLRGDGQAGLFDAREARDLAARQADRERMESTLARDLDALRDSSELHLGEMDIEFVLGGRP